MDIESYGGMDHITSLTGHIAHNIELHQTYNILDNAYFHHALDLA